jgi:hypothetical protein
METARGSRVLWAVYALVIAFALLPVFVTEIPPLADLPNHLARAYIIDHLPASAELQKHYAVEWRLLSFQSTDLALPLLAGLLGPAFAAKVYMAATFLLLLGGTAALHRALFGHVGLWPALSALFLFNFLLAWGFVAYLSAIGLLLLLFAAWIGTEERRNALRTIFFAVGALLLLLCHPFAFASYAVLITAYALARAYRSRETAHRRILDLIDTAATLLPASVLALLSVDPSVPTVTQFGSFSDIARGLVSPTIMYMDWADLAVTYVLVMAVWLLYRRAMLRFDRRMLVPVLILFVLAIAMPASLTSVWGANLRIPCLLAFLLVASSDLRASERAVRVLAAGLVLLVAGRAIVLAVTWHGHARDIAEFRAADQALKRGSRVLATAFPGDYQRRREPAIFPLVHLAAFSVIDRDVFLPSLFAFATPLRFTAYTHGRSASRFAPVHKIVWQPRDAAFASADTATRRAVEGLAQRNLLNDSYLSVVDWAHWPEDFDYLIDFHFEPAANPVPAMLTEVARGRIFTIYRIHPPR